MDKDIIRKYLKAELKKLRDELTKEFEDGTFSDCGHSPCEENILFVKNKIKELQKESK